jgi:hypothetical protein
MKRETREGREWIVRIKIPVGVFRRLCGGKGSSVGSKGKREGLQVSPPERRSRIDGGVELFIVRRI